MGDQEKDLWDAAKAMYGMPGHTNCFLTYVYEESGDKTGLDTLVAVVVATDDGKEAVAVSREKDGRAQPVFDALEKLQANGKSFSRASLRQLFPPFGPSAYRVHSFDGGLGAAGSLQDLTQGIYEEVLNKTTGYLTTGGPPFGQIDAPGCYSVVSTLDADGNPADPIALLLVEDGGNGYCLVSRRNDPRAEPMEKFIWAIKEIDYWKGDMRVETVQYVDDLMAQVPNRPAHGERGPWTGAQLEYMGRCLTGVLHVSKPEPVTLGRSFVETANELVVEGKILSSPPKFWSGGLNGNNLGGL